MTQITLHIHIDELCLNADINQEAIIEVVEYGIVTPIEGDTLSEWAFDLESAHWIKKAVKLSQELQIDWVATAMVIELMRTKQQLEKENSQLKARLSRLL
ncbi:chaperone modulator CbpM [uncultured Paraglaciecola sp.]|uniref:chaperone modulator CbpM n=1 Tax=uncultured Paraglaciecola sp. TaxID=1765024 RepID=UPI0030DCD5E8|tara:strand:- start:144912 stop:145211 length:300 start_codon:yes stop_codon:yes gene_type:complete